MQLSCDLSVLLLHGYNIFVLPLTNIDHILPAFDRDFVLNTCIDNSA